MLSLFPLDVLDGIWDLIESASEEFLTYSWFFGDFRYGVPLFIVILVLYKYKNR